jgi:hypothetical protein
MTVGSYKVVKVALQKQCYVDAVPGTETMSVCDGALYYCRVSRLIT